MIQMFFVAADSTPQLNSKSKNVYIGSCVQVLELVHENEHALSIFWT